MTEQVEVIKRDGYVLQSRISKRYITLDYHSGGYPYECAFENAKVFKSLAEAVNLRGDQDWRIMRITSTTLVEDTAEDYQKALEEYERAKENLKRFQK